MTLSPPYSGTASEHRARREKRRAQIIDAAGALFSESGYHDTTMEDVSRYVAISKPVLYQHFPSKLDLYLTVLDKNLNRLVASVRQALRSSRGNHGERVRAAIQAFFDFIDSNDGTSRLVFESNLLTEPAVQRCLDRAMDSCIDAVCDVVAENAELDAHVARILAVSLVGAGRQSAIYWSQSQEPIPKETAIDAVAALCWGGLSSIRHAH